MHYPIVNKIPTGINAFTQMTLQNNIVETNLPVCAYLGSPGSNVLFEHNSKAYWPIDDNCIPSLFQISQFCVQNNLNNMYPPSKSKGAL